MSQGKGRRDPWPSLSEIRPKSGWDPAARAHWEADMAEGNPDRRWLAWVHLHTVCGRPPLRDGKDYLRSPFCADAKGRALFLRDAARELNMDPSLLRRTFEKSVAQGKVVVREGDPRIYLGTEFQPAEQQAKIKRNEKDCTVLFSLYPVEIVEALKAFSPERLKRFSEEHWEEEKAFQEAQAEAVTALRAIKSEYDHKRLQAWGLPQKSEQPKLRRERPQAVELLRPLYKRTAQSENETVQSQKEGLYTAKNRTPESSPSLFTSKFKVQSSEGPSAPELYIETQPAAATLQPNQNGGGGTRSNSNGYAQFVKHCMEQCKFPTPGTPQLWERIKRSFGDAATDEILKYLIVLDGQDGPGLWASYSAEALRAMNGKQPKKLTRNEKLAAEVLAEMRGKAAKV